MSVVQRLHQPQFSRRNAFSRQQRKRLCNKSSQGPSLPDLAEEKKDPESLSLPPWWFTAAYQWEGWMENGGVSPQRKEARRRQKSSGLIRRLPHRDLCDEMARASLPRVRAKTTEPVTQPKQHNNQHPLPCELDESSDALWVPPCHVWNLVAARATGTSAQRMGPLFGRPNHYAQSPGRFGFPRGPGKSTYFRALSSPSPGRAVITSF